MTTRAERIASLVKVMSPKQLLKSLLSHHDAGYKVLSRAMGRELLRRCEAASQDNG